MKVIESHTVSNLPESVRISDYVAGIFTTIPSRKGMKKAIDRGRVLLNGKKARTADQLVGGERIELLENHLQNRPEIPLSLRVIYEDDQLAVIDKPAGVEVSGNKRWTITNALSTNLQASSEPDALRFAHPVHRLDFPTSGVLLVGKTASCVMALNRLFEERKVEKVYHAVVIKEIIAEGDIHFPVDGKSSHTHFQLLQSVHSVRFGSLSLLQLHPYTGRRHQLRKQLSELGNPILGDKDYGIEGLILNGKGLYLHASSLRFIHPFTKAEIFVESTLPKKFRKLFP